MEVGEGPSTEAETVKCVKLLRLERPWLFWKTPAHVNIGGDKML